MMPREDDNRDTSGSMVTDAWREVGKHHSSDEVR
jgi:hypothetical protein